MKQKDFNALNLQKGDNCKFTFRSIRMWDKCIYTGNGEYTGQSKPVTDTNIFKRNNWASDFYMIYTRQIITIEKI